MIFLPLVTAVLLLACGSYALRQNPHRPTNRILALICFVGSIVQWLQVVARIKGERFWVDATSNPLPWVRLRYVFIALLCPFLIWTCYYTISGRYRSTQQLTGKLLPWAVVSMFLMICPFFESFKPSNSRPDNLVSGPLFTIYLVVILLSMLALCVASMVVAGKLTGIRQLEFRFITITFGYLGVAVFSCTLINALFPTLPGFEFLAKTLSFFVWIAFCASVWSVTTKRVYQSSQVLIPFAERLTSLVIVAIPAVVALRYLPHFDDSLTAKLGIVAIACLGFLVVDQKFRGILKLRSSDKLGAVVHQLNTASLAEPTPEELVREIENAFGGFVDGTRVRVLVAVQDQFVHPSFAIGRDELDVSKLKEDGWISTVSLARTGHQPEVKRLRQKLIDADIHLLVGSHSAEHRTSFVVAIDDRENGYPFTYPEVQALRTLVERAEGIYTRIRLSLQARQAEQLATIGLVGAGIAHELRNPIVSIGTFAELLPDHLNDPDFLRDFALVVPGEGKRVQKLTEQLLDLAKPRRYKFGQVNVSNVIEEAMILVRKKAADSDIQLRFDIAPSLPTIVADADALRQVLLNLLLNGIQSVARTLTQREVRVVAWTENGSIVIEIRDTGAGIPDTIRDRLFHPFASGQKEGGVGLGLAICAEIIRIHKGTIVGGNLPTAGAYFRLALPMLSEHEQSGPSQHSNQRPHSQPNLTPWLGLKSTGEAS